MVYMKMVNSPVSKCNNRQLSLKVINSKIMIGERKSATLFGNPRYILCYVRCSS